MRRPRTSKWIGPAAWAAREARAGDRLPYACHLDERTLQLRDGALARMIQVPGLPADTEDTEALDHHLGVRETVLRSALDARFVVYHHVVRRRVEVFQDDDLAAPFCRHLAGRWQQVLGARRLFVNEQVLTIVRRPARGKAGWAERLRRRTGGGRAEVNAARELDAAATAIAAGLDGYGARPLGFYDGIGGVCSEPLELLSAIYNGETRPMLVPPAAVDLGYHLPYSRVSFGLDAIETRSPAGVGFAAMVSLKDYPDATHAGLVDALLVNLVSQVCVLCD